LHYASLCNRFSDGIQQAIQPLFKPGSLPEILQFSKTEGYDRNVSDNNGGDSLLVHGFLRKFEMIYPNKLFGLTLITSLLFVITIKKNALLAIFILLLTILINYYGYEVRKKYYQNNENALMCELASARLSESLIFILFLKPWYFFFIINCLLTLYTFNKKRVITLPLRGLFLAYLIVTYLINLIGPY
jgi:hypothetical protein